MCSRSVEGQTLTEASFFALTERDNLEVFRSRTSSLMKPGSGKPFHLVDRGLWEEEADESRLRT